MAKIIIGLVGPIASGKEAAKKYLSQKYNSKDCKFSTSLRDVVRRLGIPESRENLQNLSTVLRSAFGEDLLSKTIAKDAAGLDVDVVVIDGIRRMSDIVHLKDLPNFYIISVDADPKIRYERMKSRNENQGDAEKTFEEFMADHERETEKQISEVMSYAKFRIDNGGTIDDLYSQIDSIISKIS